MTSPFAQQSAGIEPPSKRRIPKALKVTLAVIVALFLFGQAFGESAQDRDDAAGEIAPPTTTSTPSNTPSAETTTPKPSPATTTTSRPAGDAYRVTDVVDGDTVKLTRLAGGGQVTVRALGIDTPETRDPRKGVGCFGPEASAWANRLLQGKQVTIRTDPTQDTRDRYGRVLAYIILPDGKDYSTVAARSGYAKYYLYRTPVARTSKIQAAERSARSGGQGLWGAPCYGNTDAAPKTHARPAPKPVATQPAPQPVAPAGGSAYYQNCDAARSAGAAPVRAGEPGYGRHLDRDGDGVGCE